LSISYGSDILDPEKRKQFLDDVFIIMRPFKTQKVRKQIREAAHKRLKDTPYAVEVAKLLQNLVDGFRDDATILGEAGAPPGSFPQDNKE
jgi:hypothetical protein